MTLEYQCTVHVGHCEPALGLTGDPHTFTTQEYGPQKIKFISLGERKVCICARNKL